MDPYIESLTKEQLLMNISRQKGWLERYNACNDITHANTCKEIISRLCQELGSKGGKC